jgi:hypothetical protein
MALSPVEIYYPVLAGGYNPSLPPRIMSPDGPFIYRDALNLLEREGALTRRALLADASASGLTPPYQLLAGTTGDAEVPVYIFTLDCRAGAVNDTCLIVVTNRNIWIRLLITGSWKLCTPTYTTGTITATNGLTGITGAGTAWVTNNLNGAAALLKDNATGTYYQLSAVPADTSITLATPWLGTTGAGKAYTLLRVFPGGAVLDATATEIFATVFNNDLYVAGTWCGGSASPSTVRSPAVIRVANIFTATPTTTYVTAQKQLSPGLDIVTNMDRICGLKALQDGRLVVAGAQNVSFYSSLLNTAVWTVSPGGQTPLIDIDGRINALGNLGTTLTYHHNEGVVLGYPTGQRDPPLTYRASKATQGVYAPRSLREIAGVEYGLSVHGSVIAFDLDRSTVISSPIRSALTGLFRADLYLFHGCVDKDRHEYTLLRMVAPDTFAWTYQADYDRWWPLRFGAPIGAISDGAAISVLTPITRALAGLSSINGTEVTDFIFYFRETVPGDAVVYSGGSNGGFYVVTDDTDFGNPLLYSNIQRIILWCNSVGFTSDTAQVSISRNQGVNWTAASGSVTFAGGALLESIKQFSFDELTPGAGRAWRFKLETAGAVDVKLGFLRMKVLGVQSGLLDGVEL